MNGRRFLPERLRPTAPSLRRARRGLATVAAVPLLVAIAPLWRIQTVEVVACPGIPVEEVAALEALEGRPALTVRLSDIRERLAHWPGVASVEVSLHLPGRLVVTTRPREVLASTRVDGRWRAVHGDGAIGPDLETPVWPTLEGFLGDEARQRAIEVVARVEAGCGLKVLTAAWVTPDDLRLELAGAAAETAAVVHVRPGGSAAERWWCERSASGELPARWADLRGASRIVLGGAP